MKSRGFKIIAKTTSVLFLFFAAILTFWQEWNGYNNLGSVIALSAGMGLLISSLVDSFFKEKYRIIEFIFAVAVIAFVLWIQISKLLPT